MDDDWQAVAAEVRKRMSALRMTTAELARKTARNLPREPSVASPIVRVERKLDELLARIPPPGIMTPVQDGSASAQAARGGP